ncbi:MAG: VOC family protein [Gammaproteobacteria bacterium]
MAADDTATGLAGPLHTITVITPDWQPLERLFVTGLGLKQTAKAEVLPTTLNVQQRLWGIPETINWQTRILSRPAVPGTAQLRVLVTDQATTAHRLSWDRQELGPYGMGFPTLNVFAWDEELLELGFERATAEVEVFDVTAPNGSVYNVHEATFLGPEFMRVIAISRKGGLPQVGIFDAVTARGGPAYATQIVPDIDAMLDLLTNVLDYEVRSDRTWSEYPIPFRFTLVHARGSNTGHVALVEYATEHTKKGSGVVPRPPARGMVMWTFEVTDLAAVAARAAAQNIEPMAGPVTYKSPSLGQHTAMTFVAPNGFLIEVFQRN